MHNYLGTKCISNHPNGRTRAWLGLFGAIMAIFLLLRIGLLLWGGVSGLYSKELMKVFFLGAMYDFIISTLFVFPLVIFCSLVSNRIFITKASKVFVLLVTLVVAFLVVFISTAEIFFWEEFGTRFNFIAVDYLIYTTEVIGNIRESYPMPLIFVALFTVAALVVFGLAKANCFKMSNPAVTTIRQRLVFLAAYSAITASGVLVLNNEMADRVSVNIFAQELAKNGAFSFVAAFRNNSLDYEKFYPVLPSGMAFAKARKSLLKANEQWTEANQTSISRQITNIAPSNRWNVIQITVESLSASFLGTMGNTNHLTPNIDKLTKNSLFFTRFYATGNRTDRGMEALTLSVPPSPGRSIVKRPNNEHLFTMGKVFQDRGYDTSFIYGGFGYFDNMNYFFGQNGYKILDRTAVPKEEISFANAWGACDEDVFRWATKEADNSFALGKPFYQFIMTTSNHRPYTYPEGRIDIPSHTGRAGAVKYTDYAIGQFIEAARGKPWFTNTLFVIVADHCASSAGKSDLSVEGYEIPLLIYNPTLVAPRTVDTLSSQIDYAPTLFALMGWSYLSEFFGSDILAMTKEAGRSFIANYQKLGYLDRSRLTILKPKRKVAAYTYQRGKPGLSPIEQDPEMEEEAISYYQVASQLFKAHTKHSDLVDYSNITNNN